jgi:heme/copper-type cytochrome/quinol oxidase subunit 1
VFTLSSITVAVLLAICVPSLAIAAVMVLIDVVKSVKNRNK